MLSSHYRLIVNSVKDVIFQIDTQGVWTFLNPAWTEITGFPHGASLGRDILDFIHPDDRQGAADLQLEEQVRELREKGNNRYQIADILKKRHGEKALTPSGVYKVLRRLGMNRLLATLTIVGLLVVGVVGLTALTAPVIVRELVEPARREEDRHRDRRPEDRRLDRDAPDVDAHARPDVPP